MVRRQENGANRSCEDDAMRRAIVSDEPLNALQWYIGPKGPVAIVGEVERSIFVFSTRARKHSPFTVAMCIPTGAIAQ